MSSQFKPLSNRIIVKPLEEDHATKSGIVLPDSAKEKPTLGKVVEVGPGKVTDKGKKLTMTVKEGDIVLHSKYGGTEFNDEATEYLIISEDDVLAIKKS
jgi:chaperonin GroES